MQAIVITPTNCGILTQTMSPNEKDVKVLIRFFWCLWRGIPRRVAVVTCPTGCVRLSTELRLVLIEGQVTVPFLVAFPQASAQSAAAEPLRGSLPDYVTK